MLDPACGSGSFLLGAYEYLLDWHRDWYVAAGPEKHKKQLAPRPGGGWRLTLAEKRRILLDNIYGVDIDPQAVEVTKLSLLLKVLEGESQVALLAKERALPDLDRNIRCGNSLVGPDFYDTAGAVDAETRLRVNAFDWKKAFPKVMNAGGFDAVIGNPPYIRIQILNEWAPETVPYCKERYRAAGSGNYDIYVVFVERGLQLLNANGRFGFILPHKFFNSDYGEPLRALLADGSHAEEVLHFGHQQVFAGATTYTCILLLTARKNPQLHIRHVSDLAAWLKAGTEVSGNVASSEFGSGEWQFVIGPARDLISRLRRLPVKLGDIADVFVGLQTSADDVYILDILDESSGTTTVYSNALGQQQGWRTTWP